MANAPEMKVLITGDASSAMNALSGFAAKVASTVDSATGGFGKLAAGFGGVAGAATALAEKGLEGLKAVAEFAPEAAAKANDQARSFKDLRVQLGENLQTLSVYDATMKLTGGTIEELADWLGGVTKAMRANSEVFIANGIAADQTALMHMKPVEVMRAAFDIIERETDQTRKLVLAQEMLGKGAINQLPSMKEFFDTMSEGNDVLKEFGGEVTEASIAQLERMERAVGKTQIAMDKLQREVAKNYEPTDKFFGMVNRGLMNLADYGLKAINGIGPLFRMIGNPGKWISETMAAENAAIYAASDEGRREAMRGVSGHTVAGPKAKTKEELAAEAEAKKKAEAAAEKAKREAEAAAKKAAEVLANLDEKRLGYEADSTKTLDASTAAMKRQREEAEALDELQKRYRDIDAELAKSDTPENAMAAINARAAAYQWYGDRVLQIKRETDAAEIEEEKKKIAAEVAERRKALEDLRKELAEQTTISGGMTQDEIQQVLARYRARGGAGAEAAGAYAREQHIGEGPEAGAQAGMRGFVSDYRNQFNTWKGFTTSVLDGTQGAFSNFFDSLTQKGQSFSQKMKALWKGVTGSITKALSDIMAKHLVSWAVEKAISTWKTADTAKQIAMTGHETAARASAAAANTAINSAALASDVATGTAETAVAEQTMAAKIYAWYASLGPWAIPAAAATIAAVIMAINQIGKITAHAQGGVIDRPTLALMGEGSDTEIVANETSFKDWGNAQLALGANLARHDAQVGRLNAEAGGYSRSGLAASGGKVPGALTVQINGGVFAGSLDGRRAVKAMVGQALMDLRSN